MRDGKHTKAEIMLRPGDIHNLTDSILALFYKTSFCCGHKGHFNDGVHIAFKEYAADDSAIVSGLYCTDCAEEYCKGDIKAWKVTCKEDLTKRPVSA